MNSFLRSSILDSRPIVYCLYFSISSFIYWILSLSMFYKFFEEPISFYLLMSESLELRNSFLCRQRANYFSLSILNCKYYSLSFWYFWLVSWIFLRLFSISWFIIFFIFSIWLSFFTSIFYKFYRFEFACINSFYFLLKSKLSI